MDALNKIYRSSLTLLTDLYQLTMAYGYWKSGMAEREAVFNLFFRSNPFDGGFAIASGLEYAVDYIRNFQPAPDDIEYLATLTGSDGKPLFEKAFLDYLADLKFTCEIDAVPEGTVVFPHEPLIRVRGPLLQCQIVETPLLTMVNFQTLIATKSARIRMVAGDDAVLEFGLRRAQGVDGGLSAARAAYVGGADATSNVLAGKIFGIPVKGTHAHSWVMAYESEMEAFETYAKVMPNNCIFLVDTFDTLEGVRKAVEVGKKLRARGYEMNGVRLDSGDLVELSIGARKILDEGGFPEAKIVASNSLNDWTIQELKEKGAQITVWGVGTKLATAYDQPALGGVYKLSAIRGADGEWDYKIKLSENLIKVSNPGLLQVKRMYKNGQICGDLMYNEESGVGGSKMMDPVHAGEFVEMPDFDQSEDLLVPVFRNGELTYKLPSLQDIRSRTIAQLAQLPNEYKVLKDAPEFPMGLEESLYGLKMQLIEKARKG